MARIQYKLTPFSKPKALSGKLCVIVNTSITIGENTTIYNIDTAGVQTTGFYGVGVAKYKNGHFSIIIEGLEYEFTSTGSFFGSTPTFYKLVMGEIVVAPVAAGDAIPTNTNATTTKTRAEGASEDTITQNITYGATKQILINNLTPRDEFALQALRGILSHVEDPASLSDSEMNYFCEQAYQWAANMMSAAANVRAVVQDNTSAVAATEPVKSLDSNTEKLLNNISIQLGNINTSVGNIEGGGGGGGSSSGEIEVVSMPPINIGANGLGNDADNPIYISGGGFPSRDVLGATFAKNVLHDILTFNAAGAVGYTPITEIISLIDDRIKAYLDSLEIVADSSKPSGYAIQYTAP